MNKKLIISKTILFLFIIGFILIFKAIFGQDNILIGVTTITAMLMLLEKDLTLSPIKNTFKLISLNIFIGLTAYLIPLNMWLAIPLNFITVFILSYSLCYKLKTPIYLPFSLEYLFIMANPVGTNKLPLRFSSLIFGAICIMLIQLVANKNKISNSSNKILNTVCENLLKKLDLVRSYKDSSILDDEIYTEINKFRKVIYDKRKNCFYLTNEGRICVNLSVELEKLYLSLNKITPTESTEDFLNDLQLLLVRVKENLNNKDTIKTSDHTFQEIIYKYKSNNIKKSIVLEIINNIDLLNNSLIQLQKLDKRHYNLIEQFEEIPTKFQNITLYKNNLCSNSLKFSYAIRIALGITIGGFIMDFFHLSEGRWILLTVLSLVNPIYEISKQKIKDRLIATIIGAIILSILFSIFKDATIRIGILMLSGYISSYTTQYKHNMICVTVSAIGAVALVGNTQVLALNRILLVALGAFIVIVINKFVLPYNLDNANNDLKIMYKDTIKEMLKEVYASAKNKQNNHSMKNLFIITSLIEDRFKLNNQSLNSKKDTSFIKNHRFLVTNIYQLYMWILKNKEKKSSVKFLLDYVKHIAECEYTKANELLDNFKKQIERVHDINDKIALHLIMNISKDLVEMNIG